MSSFSSFFAKFPGLVESEFRKIFAMNGMYKNIPEGSYGFLELFCDRPSCDCRHVIIHVISMEPGFKVRAVLRYGWESKDFYIDWMGDENELTELMPGPFIDTMYSPNDLVAEEFLSVFMHMIQNDKQYVKRIETHYQMHKDEIDNEEKPQPYRLSSEKTGRNDPCLCGSGKKYKKCCLN